MKHSLVILAGLLGCQGAFAACPESMQRDPSFVTLAVDEKTPRPSSADDFKFIGDTTTLDELQVKLGSPDAAKGTHTFVWCLADGTIVTVTSRDGSDIRQVRAGGKLLYKRK
jgi:hypothetical protein